MKVWCQKCQKLIHGAMTAIDRDVRRRSVTVTVWCHGSEQSMAVSDMIGEAMDGTATLTAFANPVSIVVDRDRGDEDPNEPWQGDSCQM